MGDTILERYGPARIAQVVSSFYGEVLQSPRLGPYFHDVPMRRLIDHQTMFMAMVLGGPQAFTADEIQIAHHQLRITRSDFDEMLRLLEAALLRFDVEDEHTRMVLAGYQALEEQVVAPPGE